MSYAMFAQNKLMMTGLLNRYQQQQMQRSDEQFRLSTQTTTLQSTITSINASQAAQLSKKFEELASVTEEADRTTINEEIHALQEGFNAELATIQNEITAISLKENVIELEIRRLDTQVTAIQKRLDTVEDAEGKGIESATPKFTGVG